VVVLLLLRNLSKEPDTNLVNAPPPRNAEFSTKSERITLIVMSVGVYSALKLEKFPYGLIRSPRIDKPPPLVNSDLPFPIN